MSRKPLPPAEESVMDQSSRTMVEATGKTTSCCIKTTMKKGPWTREEDELLSSYIKREGEGRWQTLPKKAGLLRCGKSCRLRWMNYLRPSIKRGHISPDEEDLILRLHRLLGNRWSLIAGRIPGRTDNDIKNYWNTHLSKKLLSRGIDPKTHKPLSSPSSSPADQPEMISRNPHESISNVSSNNGKDVALPAFLVSTGNDQMKQYCGNEDDVLSYPPDDVFTSFLDSLINEEMCDENPPPAQSKRDDDEDEDATMSAPGSASMKQHGIKNFNGNPQR